MTAAPTTPSPDKHEPLYQIGIDCGSKTVKVCLCDENSTLIYSVYRRHRSNIKVTLSEVLHELAWRYGDLKGTVAITGSAGISVAEALNLPFVQEVVATTKIVKKEYPQADCVIELGGEDAKIIYLTDGLEQRMNATCAGGTGGFIDNIAYMLGVRTADMDKLSMGSSHIYPIASRCAVFAQTDIRPLMNAGAKTTDLAGSTLDAVVRQTLGGLACGRPITGTVIFLGGPFEFLSDLAVRFRKALNLDNSTGIRPVGAQFFTARGAGLYGAQLPGATITSVRELEERIKAASFRDAGLERLEPLFRSAEELSAFKERHAQARLERDNLFCAKGPLYVGIDAGSTAVKIAVVNQAGNLVWGSYQENHGDVLETAAETLADMYRDFPRAYHGDDYVYVAHAVATGYGEDMLKACLGVDSGIVETTAHVQGALAFAPQASFVLDIGGQDMKAIWVKDGLVQNAILNEACSSGCGSFISGTAHSLHLTKERFAEAALCAESPVDLGTKCTVFMNSRLKHAQKVGAGPNDLAAGCAYSVVKNALFRIIGLNNLDSLGDTIVVQGGTFMNDAILRAFELLAGKEVIRPDRANLMGALGAALMARKRAQAAEGAKSETAGLAPDFAPADRVAPADRSTEAAEPSSKAPRSSLISADELKTFKPQRSSRLCEGCTNACTLSVVSVEGKRNYIGGNRCGKALELYATSQKSSTRSAPNAVAVERGLIERLTDCEGSTSRGRLRLGIMNTLLTYATTPFWHALFKALGFTVLIPQEKNAKLFRVDSAGADTIPSESVCHPAKLSHKRLKELSDANATHVFMPHYERGTNCTVSTEYACALKDGASRSLELARHMISPSLPLIPPAKMAQREDVRNELLSVLNEALEPFGEALSPDELQEAFAVGLAAQQAHEDLIRKANQRALTWIEANPRHHGVLLMGRPYHSDSATGHRIDEVLADLGLAVLSPNVITHDEAPRVDRSSDAMAWKRSSHLLRLANYALQHPRVEAVALQSFACLYDAINVIDAQNYLQEQGRVFTALKIDEISDIAHLRIRLRTLAENIEQIDFVDQMAERKIQEAPVDTSPLPEMRVWGELDPSQIQYALEGSVEAFASLDAADVETARTHTHDLCYTTAALVGRSIRLLAACPHLERLTLPSVCQRCVLEALPSILKRVSGKTLDIRWENSWPIPKSEYELPTTTDSAPLVGIIGTAPLVFDPFLNDSLVSVIKAHGCTPVLPQVEALFTDDVRYLDQLQCFYDQGVRQVIYLQSFSCLKGHVHVRGNLHALAERFPGMNIVVLDYDPEASALNRENRVLLTLAAALEV